METKGFGGSPSENSRKALQSETWQAARDAMRGKKESRHFTAEETEDNAYGETWGQVVKEYLRTGYSAEDIKSEITVLGVTYKTLKRPEVTAFYDANGDTLFDVSNERLAKEYEQITKDGAGDTVQDMDNGEVPALEPEKENELCSTPDMASERAEKELEAPATENKKAGGQGNGSAKQSAEEKLKKELAAASDRSFAEPIIGYLLQRCKEDEGLAEDVVQEHKTWKKCLDYIFSLARKQSKGNCAAVREEVVYEWAEDYYHKDDKAEEEKKAKKAAEDKAKKTATEKAKKVKSATEQKTAKAKGNAEKTEKVSVPPKAEAPKVPPKSKKNPKEMDGQMDMFSMMGM